MHGSDYVTSYCHVNLFFRTLSYVILGRLYIILMGLSAQVSLGCINFAKHRILESGTDTIFF
jgi:hypothetical protein